MGSNSLWMCVCLWMCTYRWMCVYLCMFVYLYIRAEVSPQYECQYYLYRNVGELSINVCINMSVRIIYTEMWANLLWMCVYLYIHELSMNVCIIKKMCVYLYIHADTPSPCSPWMCVCVCVCMCVYVCVMSKSVCIIYTEMWTNSVWMCVYLHIHVDLPSTCSLCARGQE